MKVKKPLAFHLPAMIVGAVLVASMSLIASVEAHPDAEYYNARWGEGALIGGIEWRFASDVPSGGGLRERIKDGAGHWNNQNQSLRFNFQANQPDYAAFNFGSCPPLDQNEKNAVHWGPIEGPAIGSVNLCTFAEAGGQSTTTYHSFQMKMDSTVNWYTGADPPGQNDNDIEGAVTHEWGHATGREVGGAGSGHFSNGWSVCNQTGSEHHTMCETVILNRDWDRSLNTHDRDVFDSKY